MPLRRLATDMQDKHDMPLITADDTVGFFLSRDKFFHLLVFFFQITMCLANLMMTGSATPFLHNG